MSDMVSYDTLQYSQALDAHNDSQDMHKPHNTRTKRIKPIPTRWRPPSSFIPRLIFHIMCFCLTFHWNLDFMWEIFREPNGWENFHTLYLTQINQLSTVVCWYIFQRIIFLIVLDSKDWSSRLSQSLSPLHPLYHRSTTRLVDRIHSYRNRWCSRCSVYYSSSTPLSWDRVIKSRKPSK
jgi:hypothetical protein